MAAKQRRKRERWTAKDGRRVGFIRNCKDGSKRYVIDCYMNGRRYEGISTGAFTLAAARDEFEAFRKSPGAYVPAGGPRDPGVWLDAELVTRFLKHSKYEKENTKNYLAQQRRSLLWWMERLNGVDLRDGDALHSRMTDAATGATAKKMKLRILRAFTRWCASQRILRFDPLQFFRIEPEVPRDLNKEPAGIEAVRSAYSHMAPGIYRDVLTVVLATGWRFAAIERFANGEGYATTYKGQPALYVPSKKNKKAAKRIVSEAQADAAKRLQEHALKLRHEHYSTALKAACKAAGVKPLTPGDVRKAIASAVYEEFGPADGAAAIGDTLRTAQKYYARHAAEPALPDLLGDAG